MKLWAGNGQQPPFRRWEDSFLLPCPCCGRQVYWYDLNSPIDQSMSINQEDPAIICECGLMMRRRNMIKAKQAWNNRADKEECFFDLSEDKDDTSHRWTREICSNCGHIFETDNFESRGFANYDFKYCPECGAKVID